MWAKRCIDSERGIAGDFVYNYYFGFEITLKFSLSHLNIISVL